MPVQKLTVTRHGKVYDCYIGIDQATKKNTLYFETDDEPNANGLVTRWWFRKLVIDAAPVNGIEEGKGSVSQMYTVWHRGLIANGLPVPGNVKPEDMFTEQYDMENFLTSALAFPILVYLLNGAFRYDNILGHNHLPPFNSATMQPAVYTAFEEAAAPTRDSRTWRPGMPKPHSLDPNYVPPVEPEPENESPYSTGS